MPHRKKGGAPAGGAPAQPPSPAVLVVAGVTPGAGCTSVTAGLCAALRSRGHVVQAFTTGPDPHAAAVLFAATGRPVGPPLDAWTRGRAAVLASLWDGAKGAGVCVVDGSGGALDGALPGPRGRCGADETREASLAPALSLPAAWKREAEAAAAAARRAGTSGAASPVSAASALSPRDASTPGGSAAFGSAGSSMADDASSTDPSPAKTGAATPGGGGRKAAAVAAAAAAADAAFDAAADGSPAQLAALLGAPLVLVVDGAGGGGPLAGAPRGVAALVKGCAGLLAEAWASHPPPPSPPSPSRAFLAGVLLARVPTPQAGKWLAGELAAARVGAPVLGALPDDPAAGLGPARCAPGGGGRGKASTPALAYDAPPPAPGSPAATALAARAAGAGALTAMHADLGAVLAAARRAAVPPPPPAPPPPRPPPSSTPLKVAVAADAAFWASGPGDAAALEAAGCALVPWSPLADGGLPPGVSGVVIGPCGAPARHAAALAANAAARAALAAFASAGGAVWACGEGCAYAGESLACGGGGRGGIAGAGAAAAPMAGLFPFRARWRGSGGGAGRDGPFAPSTYLSRRRPSPVEVVTTGAWRGVWPAGLVGRGAATRRVELLVESPVGADLAGPSSPLGSAGVDDGTDDDGGRSVASGVDAGSSDGDGDGGPRTPTSSGHGSPSALTGAPRARRPAWSAAYTARRAAPGASAVPEGYARRRALASAVGLDLGASPDLVAAWVACALAPVDAAAAGAAAAAAAAAAVPDPAWVAAATHAAHARAAKAAGGSGRARAGHARRASVGEGHAAPAPRGPPGWSPPGGLSPALLASPQSGAGSGGMPRSLSVAASPDRPVGDGLSAFAAAAAAAAAAARLGPPHAHAAFPPSVLGAAGGYGHLPPSASVPNLLAAGGASPFHPTRPAPPPPLHPGSEAGSGGSPARGGSVHHAQHAAGHARTASSGSLAGFGGSAPVPGCPCPACAAAASGGEAPWSPPPPASGRAKPRPAGGGGSGGAPSGSSPVTTLARAPSSGDGPGGRRGSGSGGGRSARGAVAHHHPPPPPRPPSFHFPSPADLAASAGGMPAGQQQQHPLAPPPPPPPQPLLATTLPTPSSPAALQNVAAWRTAGDGIACLSPLAAECVAALGLGGRACGVVAGGSAPGLGGGGADPPIAATAPAPGVAAAVDGSWLASERPGLVIAAGGGSAAAALAGMDPAGPGVPAPAAAAAVSAAGLAAHGARVLALAPRTLADVGDALLAVAAAAGVHPAAAGAAVSAFRARLRAAARAAAGQPRRPRVAVLVSLGDGDGRPLSAGGGWVPELVSLAGGVDVLAGCVEPGDAPAALAGMNSGEPPGRPAAPAPPGAAAATTQASLPPPLPSVWEEVRKGAPDVLVLAAAGRAGGSTGPLTHPPGLDRLAALPGFWSLPAVRAGRVFLVDRALLARPGPRLADGLDLLVALLHGTGGGGGAQNGVARPLPVLSAAGFGASPRRSASPAPALGPPGTPPIILPPPGRAARLLLCGGQRCRPCLLGDYFRPWPSAGASAASGTPGRPPASPRAGGWS